MKCHDWLTMMTIESSKADLILSERKVPYTTGQGLCPLSGQKNP